MCSGRPISSPDTETAESHAVALKYAGPEMARSTWPSVLDRKGGHAYVIQQPAHLGQSLADTQLLHKGLREGCKTTVLWYVCTYESSLADLFLHDMQRVAVG